MKELKVYLPQDGPYGLEPEEGGEPVEEETCYLKSDVDAVIAELKQKLEDAKASAYAESVDAGMENRRLKRALWLARGYIMTLLQRDFQRLAYQCNNGDYKKNLLNRRNRYYDLYEKCRSKAEEYK